MRLPVEITPNPLFSSAIEIRFSTQLEKDHILSKVYPLLIGEFPEFEYNRSHIQDINRAWDSQSTEFIFRNEDYSMSIGRNILVIENVSAYRLWSNYFDFTRSQVSKLWSSGMIDKIDRVGLRFINVLPETENPEVALKSMPIYPVQGQFDHQMLRLHSTLLTVKDVTINLQIAPMARAENRGVEKVGLVIDIDCYTREVSGTMDDQLFNQIDRLHSIEKDIFFSLLREDYIAALNPKY